MNRKIKIILVFSLALLVGFGAIFYFVSSKMNPEALKKAAIEAIEKSMPGAKASIGSVSYNMGFTVNVLINDLEVLSKSDRKLLFEVNNAKLEIPVLAILKNGGTIDIKINNPHAVYKDFEDGSSNWSIALNKADSETEKKKKSKPSKDGKDERKVSTPSFLDNSRLDLSIRDLEIEMYRPGAPESVITINKILLKNLNLNKTTAFEVVSKISYGLSGDDKVSAKTQIVGEIGLSSLLEDGAFNVNMLANIEDLSLPWLSGKVPNLKNAIRIKKAPSGDMEASLRTTSGAALSLEADVAIAKAFEKVSVSNLKFSASLATIANLAPAAFKNDVQFGEARFNLNGSVLYDLLASEVDPSLEFSVAEPVKLSAGGISNAVTFRGQLVGKNFSMKLTDELLEGVATLDVSTRVNPLELPSEMSEYHPIDAKLLITSVRVKKQFIRDRLYGEKNDTPKTETASSEQSQAQNKSPDKEPISLPPFDLAIEGKHIFIDNHEMNLAGKLKGKGKELNLEELKINYGPGSSELKANMILEEMGVRGEVGMKLRNLQMAGFNAFLPPFIKNITGRFSGGMSGDFSSQENLSYNLEGNFKARDGQIKNLDLASFLMPVIQKIPVLAGKIDPEKLKISDKFDSLELEGDFSDQLSEVNKFVLVGHKQAAIVNGRGKVYNSPAKKSSVKVVITGEAIAPEVEKITNQKGLPFLFEGMGTKILPQLKYTTDKIVERAARVKIKEEKKKLEKNLHREKQKLERKLKDKAKEFLEGVNL